MKYSLKWLADYCPLHLKPRDLVERLTMAGFEVESVAAMGEDIVLDIEVVPVRSDCLCMIGLAREISVFTGAPLTLPPTSLKEIRTPQGMAIEVEVPAADLCPRYSARVVTDLKVGPSPAWLADRLETCGVRPLNNVVDVTNFVNLEMGQPLHAFDLMKLQGHRILVRRADEKEKLTLLDGTALQLTPADLVIADAGVPVALAGVMGGASSEVSGATEAVVIESAYFEPTNIRRTARRYKLATESSYRFERGVDPTQTLAAADRAAGLLADVAGGTVLGPAIDVGQVAWPRTEVVLRPARANLLIGTDLPDEEIADLLRRLRFEVNLDPRENLLITVPSYRRDVTAEVDLIEEVARAYGYDRVYPTLPAGRPPEPGRVAREEFERRAREVMTAAGFDEVYTPSFTNPAAVKEYGYGSDALVPLVNPTASQFSHLRPALWPMLAEAARRNGLLGFPGVRLFELGTVFTPGRGGEITEHYRLGALAAGEAEARHWSRASRAADFFLLRGVVEELARALNVAVEHPSAATFRLGEASGQYVTPALEPFGLAYGFELDAVSLAAAGEGPEQHFEPLWRFPSVGRDLALVLKEGVPAGEVVAAVSASNPLVREVHVFDLFTGKGIEAGYKSLGIRVRYQAGDRTLTDDEVNAAREEALAILAAKFGATLRR